MNSRLDLPDVLDNDGGCPWRGLLDRIGDRWTMLILLVLDRGTLRFGELHKAINGVTPKVLTQTLRLLERDGLVSRKVYAEVPPRVEYALTALGDSLVETVAALDTWAQRHIDEVETSRETYDRSKVAAAT